MKLTKENVLSGTNNGWDFYRQVIKNLPVLPPDKLKPVKNPFYADTKASLSIYLNNGQWLFKDFGQPEYAGDVFHFAAHYYKLDSKRDFFEILKRINQDLNLGLEETSDNPVMHQLAVIKLNAKKEASNYLQTRGIYLKKGFYQSHAYQNFPPAVVFVNHNQSGFEKRYIAGFSTLKELGLPKTKYTGIKQNTLYVDAYDQTKSSVFICEGAINALSFAQIGESAIACFGVGNIPNGKILENYIKNKIVYLAGDGDQAGQNFNSQLLNLISETNIFTLKIYRLNFPKGSDANDLLVQDELIHYQKYRKRILPFYEYRKIILKNYQPALFPLDVFTTNLKSLILELNRTLNFPVNYSAASILVAASTAIGKTVKIKVKNGWYEQAVLYMILSGRSGMNKSHPLEFALRPILKYDEIQKKEYDLAMEQYEQMVELTAKERNELGYTDLKPPVLRQIMVNDITPEALQMVHSQNPRGLGLFKDEILGWINSFDRYSNSGELQMWLSMWSGTNIRTNRSGRRPIYLSQPFVSVYGTIQNAKLTELAKPSISSTGFTDRILFTFSEMQEKPYMNTQDLSQNYIDYYDKLINKLLQIPLETDEKGQIQSKILNFSGKSKDMLLEWNRYNTDMTNKNFTSETERSLYAKLDSYFARFALILQMLYWADGEADMLEISPETVEKAIELIEYCRQNAIYAHQLIHNSTEIQANRVNEKLVAQFLKSRNKSIREIADILEKGKSTVAEWLKS